MSEGKSVGQIKSHPLGGMRTKHILNRVQALVSFLVGFAFLFSPTEDRRVQTSTAHWAAPPVI
jgi:hypothetical protein